MTRRTSDHPINLPVGLDVEIIYAGEEYKRAAAKRLGWDVHIWINDQPGHIEPDRKLKW